MEVTEKVCEYEKEIDMFMLRVFGLNSMDFILTDMSSIYDFDFEICHDKKSVVRDTDFYLDLILDIYGIDAREVEDLYIVDIIYMMICKGDSFGSKN